MGNIQFNVEYYLHIFYNIIIKTLKKVRYYAQWSLNSLYSYRSYYSQQEHI